MDVVVTVPEGKWLAWLAEGDLPGEKQTEEWALFFGSGRGRPPSPPTRILPGDRVYIVGAGVVRGYSPLLRIAPTPQGFALVRGAGAVAVTPYDELTGAPLHIRGFQGVRYASWKRETERPFPDFATFGLPAPVKQRVARLLKLREHPPFRAEIQARALRGVDGEALLRGHLSEAAQGRTS